MEKTYLETRGLDIEMLAELGIEQNATAQTFPYYDQDGMLLYRKIRRSNGDGTKNFRRDRKDVKTVPFLLNKLSPDANYVFITEGEIDALSLMEAGQTNVIGVPDGAQTKETEVIDTTNDGAFSWMWDRDGNLVKPLCSAEKIIICMDDDAPGRNMLRELAIRLDPLRCYYPVHPEGCNDLNDILRKHGPEKLSELVVVKRQPYIPRTVVSSKEFRRRPPRESLAVSVDWMKPRARWSPPMLMTVTGPPNHGKSQFLMWYCMHLARDLGIRTLFIPFEDDTEKIYRSVERAHGGVPSVAEEFEQKFFRYVDVEAAREHDDVTVEWAKLKIMEAVQREGCRHIVIDSWNNMAHNWGRESQIVYLDRCLNDLFSLSRRLNCVITIVTHPTAYAGRNNKEPSDWDLYSIDHGAAWNNKVDLGMAVFRDLSESAKEGAAWIATVKSRNTKHFGRLGWETVLFDEKNCRYRKAI